jgi:hypothetical protein
MSFGSGNEHDKNGKPVRHTQGEKFYDMVFNTGINFALNLTVSAMFSHWVKNSTKPVWKDAPFAKEILSRSPIAAYETIVGKLQKAPFMATFKSDASKREVASKMADLLVLTTPGWAVMVPSVWLGEKFKSDIVHAIDKQHYGREETQPDWVRQRHDTINNGKKPTFLGAFVGRAGTVGMTQLTAYTIGSEKNIFNYLGEKGNVGFLKQFRGLDNWAGKAGDAIGGTIAKTAPELSKTTNKSLRNIGFSFSHEQIEAAKPALKGDFEAIERVRRAGGKTRIGGKLYENGLQDFSKYVALDTLYTVVTSATIGPIVSFLKEHVPGMAYTQEPRDPPVTRVSGIQNQGAIQSRHLGTAY